MQKETEIPKNGCYFVGHIESMIIRAVPLKPSLTETDWLSRLLRNIFFMKIDVNDPYDFYELLGQTCNERFKVCVIVDMKSFDAPHNLENSRTLIRKLDKDSSLFSELEVHIWIEQIGPNAFHAHYAIYAISRIGMPMDLVRDEFYEELDELRGSFIQMGGHYVDLLDHDDQIKIVDVQEWKTEKYIGAFLEKWRRVSSNMESL